MVRMGIEFVKELFRDRAAPVPKEEKKHGD